MKFLPFQVVLIVLVCSCVFAENPMLSLPGGSFSMGSGAEEIPGLMERFHVNHREVFEGETPRHVVNLSPFRLQRHEVTNAEFYQFTQEHPEWGRELIPGKFHNGRYLAHWNGNKFPEGKGDHPVTHVSWYAAVAYCQSEGMRLPTEAEWEFAARGGLTGKQFPWGDEPVDSTRANYGESGIDGTSKAGSYAPNAYGLYDMAGNAWEYLADEWGAYDAKESTDPVAGGNLFGDRSFEAVNTRRVIRGGSWQGAPVNLRVAYRDSHPPEGAGEHVGFRCASGEAQRR